MTTNYEHIMKIMTPSKMGIMAGVMRLGCNLCPAHKFCHEYKDQSKSCAEIFTLWLKKEADVKEITDWLSDTEAE